jgi:hypothetical protein
MLCLVTRSSDLILSTWHEAETGTPRRLEYRLEIREAALTGSFQASSSGLHKPILPRKRNTGSCAAAIDTGLDSNHRGRGPQVHIDIPNLAWNEFDR